MNSHTPGPWHTKGTIVLVSPRLIICEVDRGNKHPDTATANSRLIAESPAMLEALRELLNTTACPMGKLKRARWGNACDKASAILARLEGNGEA